MALPTPEIALSPLELNALLVAVAQAQVALPTNDSLEGAVSKLRALATADAQSPQLEGFCEAWFCGHKEFRSCEDHIAILMEGMLRKQRCRIDYQKPSAPESKTFDFEHYRFLFVDGDSMWSDTCRSTTARQRWG